MSNRASTHQPANHSAVRSEGSGTSEAVKVSERERTVLLAFATLGCCDEGYSIYFRTIAKHTKLDLSQVRRSTRSLARKGLTELNRGLFDDDGMIAGSGYALTRSGWDYARAHSPVAHGNEDSGSSAVKP